MDKSILEEYQKRLKQIQEPVDMKDVGSARTVDKRLSQIEGKEYSDDQEGYLLSELDKRRLDEKIDFKKIGEIIVQIEEIRKEKKEQEKAKFLDELQMQQSEIEVETSKYKKQLVQLEEQRKELLDTVEVNKKVLQLKKPESKVYQAASQENISCINMARKRARKIKQLESKIEGLEQDFNEIDKILYEIDGRQEQELAEQTRQEQEDMMWEQYANENEGPSKQQIEEEENKAYKEKADEYKFDKKQEEEDYIKETAIYDEVLAQEENAKNERDKLVAQRIKDMNNPPKPPTREGVNPPKPPTRGEVNPQQPPTREGVNPQQPPTRGEDNPQQTRVGGKPPADLPNGKNVYTIESIKFHFENGFIPTYNVAIKDQDGKIINALTSGGFKETIAPLSEKELQELNAKHIMEPRKYYDRAIAISLAEVDKQYGTKGLEQYQELIKRMNEQGFDKPKMNIEYDFSELMDKSQFTSEELENINRIKSIAKADKAQKIATYKKEPNIFKKIAYKVKNRFFRERITSGDQRTNQTTDKKAARMEQEAESKTWVEQTIDNIQALISEPGFDKSAAEEMIMASDVTMEEKIQALAKLDDMVTADTSKEKQFRVSQHVDVKPVQPQTEPKVEEKGKESKAIPLTGKVVDLDENGNVIGDR